MPRKKREGYYTIGVVSKMYDIHPQTLRLYEKRGLLHPTRSSGNTRLYSQGDLETLEFILTLTNELHVNVAGVEIIVHLRERIQELQRQLGRLGQRVEEAEAQAAEALGPECTALIRSPGSRLPQRRTRVSRADAPAPGRGARKGRS